jgi:hypothetical protein
MTDFRQTLTQIDETNNEEGTFKQKLINDANIELLKQFKDVLFKTSNAQVGSTAHMLQKSGPFGRSTKFSDYLAKAGTYTNNGLNTTLERERYIDNSKDWMLKN